MMKQEWEKISAKLEAMSLRERALVFVAVAFLLLSLINILLFDPLFAKQKLLRSQISQQQEVMNQVQTQIAALLQENSPGSTSPQRVQINRLRQEMAEGSAYLQSNRERLVLPQKMAEHLRKLLSKNNRLQLVSLQTLQVAPLLEQANAGRAGTRPAPTPALLQDKQVFKHGVRLTLRGSYPDLLQYLSALEKLPQQMFWAKAQFSVVEYPTSELTLILYTLSLDKAWLQI
ncbi:MAG: type II secretion system protein GspM [Gallionellaceae bacterium]|jgi:MSHA biogenesis protein MshJ